MAKLKTDKTPVELLTAKQAAAEYARLQTEISQHDKRYYQQDAPVISDADYDELRRRYNIGASNIVGHSQIRNGGSTACPGKLTPLTELGSKIPLENGHWNLRGFLAKKSARPVKAGRKPPGARLNW